MNVKERSWSAKSSRDRLPAVQQLPESSRDTPIPYDPYDNRLTTAISSRKSAPMVSEYRIPSLKIWPISIPRVNLLTPWPSGDTSPSTKRISAKVSEFTSRSKFTFSKCVCALLAPATKFVKPLRLLSAITVHLYRRLPGRYCRLLRA